MKGAVYKLYIIKRLLMAVGICLVILYDISEYDVKYRVISIVVLLGYVVYLFSSLRKKRHNVTKGFSLCAMSIMMFGLSFSYCYIGGSPWLLAVALAYVSLDIAVYRLQYKGKSDLSFNQKSPYTKAWALSSIALFVVSPIVALSNIPAYRLVVYIVVMTLPLAYYSRLLFFGKSYIEDANKCFMGQTLSISFATIYFLCMSKEIDFPVVSKILFVIVCLADFVNSLIVKKG